MFKHILIPTDGSELSQAAVKKGMLFAKQLGAKVTGLNVMPASHASTDEERIGREALESESYLTAIANMAMQEKIECDTLMERSDSPYDAIIWVADKRGCDLIMMASHGRRGFKALLLGSETQKVLTHSKIPVLVYR
jgi:nucleotide-binding universal stress UspA family protein